MTQNDGLLFGVLLVALAVWVLYLSLVLKGEKVRSAKLEKWYLDCVTEQSFRCEQSQRRELEAKLNALTEHLGIMVINKPQQTIAVKKGNVA